MTNHDQNTNPERDLWDASWTLDIEAVDVEAQIIHIVYVLFSGIELLPFVDILATGVASEKLIDVPISSTELQNLTETYQFQATVTFI